MKLKVSDLDTLLERAKDELLGLPREVRFLGSKRILTDGQRLAMAYLLGSVKLLNSRGELVELLVELDDSTS